MTREQAQQYVRGHDDYSVGDDDIEEVFRAAPNLHDVLVAACEAALPELIAYSNSGFADYGEYDYSPALKAIRAALALAKGLKGLTGLTESMAETDRAAAEHLAETVRSARELLDRMILLSADARCESDE